MPVFLKLLYYKNALFRNIKMSIVNNNRDLESYNAYGPLFNHLATCNGYTDLMAIFLTKMGYENYKIASDWKKWLDFFVLNQCSYKHIDLICCNFDINGISSKQSELKRKEREAILHEYFSAEQLEEIKNKISFNTKELSYKEKIFSMKNSYDKKYKIINLLGLKLKIKRRAV